LHAIAATTRDQTLLGRHAASHALLYVIPKYAGADAALQPQSLVAFFGFAVCSICGGNLQRRDRAFLFSDVPISTDTHFPQKRLTPVLPNRTVSSQFASLQLTSTQAFK